MVESLKFSIIQSVKKKKKERKKIKQQGKLPLPDPYTSYHSLVFWHYLGLPV